MDTHDIFQIARTLPDAERAAYLEEVCQDAEQRELLERMLADDWFQGVGEDEGDTAAIAEGPGTVIGAYKLLEKIGEGAFGVVFMAEQRGELARRVALKIIKEGMDTREVIARFEAERRALALMEHSHIAKVFDAGATETGRPYFVMELVRGVPITQFCDEKKHTIRQRLPLFMAVCDAVTHAHQKGIIHRDLKPSNILVGLDGERPVPKVIDFGIAKATQQRLTEKTYFTSFKQFIGTFPYLCPEQSDLSALDIDTRADIYALGVVLYELLAGRLPFDPKTLSEAGFEAMRRVVRNQEPLKPSTQVATLQGEERRTVETSHGAEMDKLRSLIRGDLDWIVMKAMEKDRERRYETANALRRDVERFLNDEPVEAGPPGTLYKVRKFMRRNQMPLAAAASVALALVAGTVVSMVLLIRALDLEQIAHNALQQEAEALKDKTHAEAEATKDKKRADREEGLAWLERSSSYRNKPGQEFTAALMAARAVGFEGFGRAQQNDAFRESFPVLLEAGTDEYEQARKDALHYSQFPRPIWRSPLLGGSVAAVEMSPEGTILASTGPHHAITLWDLERGVEARVLDAHKTPVTALSFGPRGRILASGGRDGTLMLWDLVSGGPPRRLAEHQQSIHCLAISPDGRTLASGGENKQVKLWDLEGGKATVLGEEHYDVFSLVFSPDGKTLATGSVTIKLWDLENGGLPITLNGHRSVVVSLAFSPNGLQLASGSWDETVKVWDLHKGREFQTITGHEDRVSKVAFRPDGNMLASASEDGTIRLWKHGELQEIIGLGDTGISSLAFSPDGRTLAAGSTTGRIGLWELCWVDRTDRTDRGRPTRNDSWGRGWKSDTVASAFHLGSHRFVRASSGSVELWDFRFGGRGEEWAARSDVRAIEISPDGTTLAVGYADAVQLWDLESRTQLEMLPGHTDLASIAFSPDGTHLVTGDENNIRIWRLPSGILVRTLTGRSGPITCLSFSPDGRTLASGGIESTVKLWDLRGGERQSLNAQEGPIHCLSFSANSGRLAAGCGKNSVCLWDLETGITAETFSDHNDVVTRIALSADGKCLASSGAKIILRSLEAPEMAVTIPSRGHLAFSPHGKSLAVVGPTIRWWSTDILGLNLASYWAGSEGRGPSSSELSYHNLSLHRPFRAIQVDENPNGLFTRYVLSENWNAALALLPNVGDGELRRLGGRHLVGWLREDVPRYASSHGLFPELAAFRLAGLEAVLSDSQRASAEIEELRSAIAVMRRPSQSQRFASLRDPYPYRHSRPLPSSPRKITETDWPMWGGAPDRNMVSHATDLPVDIDPGEIDYVSGKIDLMNSRGVRWVAKLGSQAYFPPTVGLGKVFITTNNESPRDPDYLGDRGVLMCLDEKTGKFLWQLVVPKLGAGKVNDWEYIGMNSAPALEGDRLWAVTNRGEVVCLDVDGLADGNDGPFLDEIGFMTVRNRSKRTRGRDDYIVPKLTEQYADIIWVYDMRREVGTFPHNGSANCPLVVGDIVYVATSNGVDWSHTNTPAPQSPALIALDKNTGKLVAEEYSGVSSRTLHANWCSPSFGKAQGKDILLWGGGDGFAYGFSATPVQAKEGGEIFPILEELWRRDANPPEYRHQPDGTPIKYATPKGPSEIVGSVAFHEGLAYVVIGQDPEHGEGVGMLSCLDAATGKVVWTYKEIGRSMCTPSIADGLVFIADYAGFLYCLDAKTGERYWTHDSFGHVWASTLVADGKVYLGTEEGELFIFKASREKELRSTIEFPSPIYASPVAANDTLYVTTTSHLYAFGMDGSLARDN